MCNLLQNFRSAGIPWIAIFEARRRYLIGKDWIQSLSWSSVFPGFTHLGLERAHKVGLVYFQGRIATLLQFERGAGRVHNIDIRTPLGIDIAGDGHAVYDMHPAFAATARKLAPKVVVEVPEQG